MKVRVCDPVKGRYFKSEVYALVNTGWYERRLVRIPGENGGCMKFFDYLDRRGGGSSPALINTIVPGEHPDWIRRSSGNVDTRIAGFERGLPEQMKFFEYIGVSWLFEETGLLARLLEGEAVPVLGSPFERRLYTCDEEGWNYVETEEDARRLFCETSGFHDSLLRELHYVSGAHGNADGTVCPVDDARRVVMEFDCQWSPGVELVFEGVTALNLRPAGDNYMSELYGASLRVAEAQVFFADSEGVREFPPDCGTWVSSYSLRWRFRPDGGREEALKNPSALRR
ncbi:MAG: hypothetical protein KH230_08420 [Enterocloster asparagiformis]|nr:hypothetical protein [Enterocloster asparagiformis]